MAGLALAVTGAELQQAGADAAAALVTEIETLSERDLDDLLERASRS